MKNAILVAVLVIIIGCALIYVYKAKQHGKKCIGCPDGTCCPNKNGCSGCNK